MERKFLIVALLAGLGFFAWKVVAQWQADRHPQFATTEQFISFACDHALADAQQYDHISLDYSVASLKQVDQILGRAHDTYAENPKSVSVPGLSMEYGAYVGEVIRRSEPSAYWTRDSQVAGKQSYPMHWKAGESFPLAWCSRRITNGEQDSIWIKYSVLKDPDQEGAQKLVVRRASTPKKLP